MNRFVQFFKDGCYDNLLLYWYDEIVAKAEKGEFLNYDKIAIPKTYVSYLPQDTFYKYFDIGISLISNGVVDEYFDIVFDTLYAELIRQNVDKNGIGEFLILKQLLLYLRSHDLDVFENIYVMLASLEANKVLSTSIYNAKQAKECTS